MVDQRHVTTMRMRLDEVTQDDLAALYTLNSDPGVWRHLPAERHPDPSVTAREIDSYRRHWETDGLGYWTARAGNGIAGATPGQVIGVGGCRTKIDAFWNLYYRFATEFWGRGLASELVGAARLAAATVRPELPVVAYLLEHNEGSRRTAERAGFALQWRGPDMGNPDPSAVRLIYADRPLPADLLERITVL